jgi:AbrB family looped-hinge helix DNA binding protein
MATTVTTKGQVTIPKKVRDFLGIKSGTMVEFRLAPDGSVVLTRADHKRPPSGLARLRGIAKGSVSTDEIMALTRGEN